MKRIFISSVFLIIIFSMFVSALSFGSSDDKIKIHSLEQLCSIEKKDLHCETLLGFFILNKTNTQISFDIYDGYGSRIVDFDNKSISLCDWPQNNKQDVYNPYLRFNLSCHSEISLSKEFPRFDELLIKINPLNLNETAYYLFFNFTVKNFIMSDPVYNALFFNVGNFPNNALIYRSIVLPKNSIIESSSLYNMNIFATLSDGRRVIFTDQPNSFFEYRDWDKEQKEQQKRDISIIFISLSFSILFSLILSRKKQTKRTKNLWLLGGIVLLVISFILFYNLIGIVWSIVLIFFFVLLLLFMGLAKASDELDMGNVSKWRDFYEIFKIIKVNKIKTVSLIILPILSLIFYFLEDFVLLFILLILFVVVIFVKTNRPSK